MLLFTRCLVLIVFCHSSAFAVSPSISKKAILLNWASRMWLDVDVSHYTCTEVKAIAVLRSRISENNFDSDTGLSLLLPDCCPEAKCDRSTCTEVAGEDQTHKFVLSKTESGAWVVSCKLFNNIELPTSQGGTPEQRSAVGGDDSTRGLAATETQSYTPIVKPSIQGFGSDPPQQGQGGTGLVIEGGNLGAVLTTTQAPTLSRVVCDSLFTTDAETFFAECCMKNGVAESDARCVLRTLLDKMEAQKKPATATTTFKSTTTAKSTIIKKTSLGFGITEADVVEEDDASTTAKASPAEASLDEAPSAKSPAEEFFSPSESDKVVWSLTGQISSWRTKYFTVLGFFVVFLVFFLLIIAALIYKLRAAKASSPPTSPGAVAGSSSYGAIGAQGDRAPLTPSTQQAQTFKY
eukprot:GFUD01008419.1.p1 GENE.GFUD01008419.1~~GFUD01008419.1.p1  ORF type:complete len:407 (-),score=70.09 GFUD01008419.1:115-1335(-)